MESKILGGLPTYTYDEFVAAVEALQKEGVSEKDIQKGLKECLGITDVPSEPKVKGRFKVRQSRLAKNSPDALSPGHTLLAGGLYYWWQKNGKVLRSQSIPPGGYTA